MKWENWELWLAAGLILVILEVFVSGFVLACLAVGAVGGAIAAVLDQSLEVQLVATAVVSILAFLFPRPLAQRKWFSGDVILTGVDALIGREAEVSEAFDSNSGKGRCRIDGDDWLAQWDSASTSDRPPALGERVTITSVLSNTLIVTEIQSS
jgi:membrane protein implicated in regulation of membrane protease activity